MSALKPVSRVTLADQVANQLAEMILDGKWGPGQRLPSEFELCKALSIGRSTLREALKSLAFVGLVHGRPGEGTYVADRFPDLLGRILARGLLRTEKDLADVCETRLTLETRLAALAAERADEADLRQMEDLLAKMQASLSGGSGAPYDELDLEFHFAIAAGAKNRVLQQLLVPIRGAIHEWIIKSQELPGKKENSLEQHSRILEAIRGRDPEQAAQAMETHLLTFQKAVDLMGSISVRNAVVEPV
jgi:GntR family transcriptional repressor for pyruvate dehydrogenase complex